MRKKIILLCFALFAVTVSLNANLNDIRFSHNVMESYIYGYPLVLMEFTKKHTIEKITLSGTQNFPKIQKFPYPDFNEDKYEEDSLNYCAWLNLSEEPIILSVPDLSHRYYVITMYDAWTNVFDSIGTRTNENKKKNYAIVGLNWKGTLPKDVKEIRSTTDLVWITARTKLEETNGKAISEIEDDYRLTPLNEWGKSKSVSENSIVSVDVKSPVNQVLMLNGVQFFGELSKLLIENPPLPQDNEAVKKLELIGIKPGKIFDSKELNRDQLYKLNKAVRQAQERIMKSWKEQSFAKKINGWTIPLDSMGHYGTDYLLRAVIAYGGLGANLSKDVIYPEATTDSEGRVLNGKNHYIIHFSKGELPPVESFWSITMYDERQSFVSNTIDRYTIGNRHSLKFNRDGSLDILIQNEPPSKHKASNWLPSPKGDFSLVMKLYQPKEELFTGVWSPPPVERRS